MSEKFEDSLVSLVQTVAEAAFEHGVNLAREYASEWLRLMMRAADGEPDHIRNQAIMEAMNRLAGLTPETIKKLEGSNG